MSARTPALRPMDWSDIPRLVELDEQLFGHHAWSDRTWWAELAGRPQRRYVVAERSGAQGSQILGYCGLDVQPEVADVMTIGVSTAAQGGGLGRLLLDDAMNFVAETGCAAMMLEVRADNLAAKRLYERAGFEQVSVRRRYYQPEGVDALVMRKLMASGSRSMGEGVTVDA